MIPEKFREEVEWFCLMAVSDDCKYRLTFDATGLMAHLECTGPSGLVHHFEIGVSEFERDDIAFFDNEFETTVDQVEFYRRMWLDAEHAVKELCQLVPCANQQTS